MKYIPEDDSIKVEYDCGIFKRYTLDKGGEKYFAAISLKDWTAHSKKCEPCATALNAGNATYAGRHAVPERNTIVAPFARLRAAIDNVTDVTWSPA